MMKKTIVTLLLLMASMTAGVQTGRAQSIDSRDSQQRWYAGLSGGTSFGQATFSSITQDGVRNWGIQGGLFGGYKLTPLISLEGSLRYGGQSQFNRDCCPYWLSTDGIWKATQVIDMDGWYFDDLKVSTRWFSFAVQANFNLLSFIRDNTRWSLDLSPQISLVNTKSTWKGDLSKGQGYYESKQPANWHLGLGGQAGAGYAFNDTWKLGIYGGVTALTGKRFDLIPNKAHKTNLIWDAGLKLTYTLGKERKPTPPAVVPVPVPQPVPQPVRKEEPAVEPEPIVEPPVPAEEPEIVEPVHVEFPVIYFADNSTKLGAETEKLKEVSRILEQYPNISIALYGYASKSGEPQYNQAISERRVEKVKNYLVELGVAAERIDLLVGKGVDLDAESNKDARRVEIVVIEK